MLKTIIIGLTIGVIDGIGIFYAPGEPYKTEIFLAAILKSILVAVMVNQTLKISSRWIHGVLFGILYGFLFAAVIFLAKGGFQSMNAPYVIPSGIVMGAITGALVWKFSIHRSNP